MLQVERPRYVPAIRSRSTRSVLGLIALTTSVVINLVGTESENVLIWVLLFVSIWSFSLFATDKYSHKYPYRYHSYLLASHLKAAAIMLAAISAALFLVPMLREEWPSALLALAAFSTLDFLVSLPRQTEKAEPFDFEQLKSRTMSGQAVNPTEEMRMPEHHDAPAFSSLSEKLGTPWIESIQSTVPDFSEDLSTLLLNDRTNYAPHSVGEPVARLLVCSVRINDLRRINRFLIAHADRLRMGGHFVCRYESLKEVRERLELRWGGISNAAFLIHFVWYRALPKIPILNKLYFLVSGGWNRNLSRAEVWGRLSYCGLTVIAEQKTELGRLVVAKRIAQPIENRKPSYYPVVGLTKVGLDGELVRTHKIRSMYPFSEFLQKQIFEDNGLASTGKFKDDFRLTEYGRYLRRYWLDELPQIFDWLRGDIKLVGIRATSPHFLSLYTEDFVDMYTKVKPGLIPPLFDEETSGFDQIVAVEVDYLEAYVKEPVLTDLRYFWATINDIVFRGVRSK